MTSAPAAAAHGIIVAAKIIAKENKTTDFHPFLPVADPSFNVHFLDYVRHLATLDNEIRQEVLDIPNTTKIHVGNEKDVSKWIYAPSYETDTDASKITSTTDGHFVVGIIQDSHFQWITSSDDMETHQSRVLQIKSLTNKKFSMRPVALNDPENVRALLDFDGWGALKQEDGVMIRVLGKIKKVDEYVLFWKEDGQRNYDLDNYLIGKVMKILQSGVHSRNQIVVEEVILPHLYISRPHNIDFADIRVAWMGHTKYFIQCIRQEASFTMDKNGGNSTSKTMVIIDKEIPNEKVISYDFSEITFGYAHVRVVPREGKSDIYVVLSTGIRKV